MAPILQIGSKLPNWDRVGKREEEIDTGGRRIKLVTSKKRRNYVLSRWSSLRYSAMTEGPRQSRGFGIDVVQSWEESPSRDRLMVQRTKMS